MGVAADEEGCGNGGEEFDDKDGRGGGGVASNCDVRKLFSSLRPHTLFKPDREIKGKKGKGRLNIDKSNTNYIHSFLLQFYIFSRRRPSCLQKSTRPTSSAYAI